MNQFTVEQNTFTFNKVVLTNVEGREVLVKTLSSNAESISTSGLEQGIYIMILSGENNTSQKRIVIE